MADDTSASIIQLHQPKKKLPMSGAERARLYRLRKRTREATTELVTVPAPKTKPQLPSGASGAVVTSQLNHSLVAPVTPSRVTSRVTPSRPLASIILAISAFGLAGVGITMNGWFARSLGSSDIAGWLFLAIGVGADAAALALPACAARLWDGRQRGAALAGWVVWAMTFAFAVTAGIGFASVNISDVTLQRASRVTPAIEAARADLADAMTSRDRECAGGVGKVCRQREDTVTIRRQALDTAMHAIERTADPQTDAAMRIVTWLSSGLLRPTSDDFAMLRLTLLAILPQIGGVLLMIGRWRPAA